MSANPDVERPFWVEVVSKLEITRFSGVALPFPKCREADTEHSGGSIFAPAVEAARFDTTSVGNRRPYPAVGGPEGPFGLRV
ncbi:hypothetical protein K6W76_21290 [Burkholderia anthina]|uniref:hypothetical protein n=1 Tax=Burkholderia anthina TaxID=179879 RepID=UPI0015893697|nr:hypothetical protein [Burkholderia anthina]MBY4869015.1 hypothetical protein [Burkholderia anthina]